MRRAFLIVALALGGLIVLALAVAVASDDAVDGALYLAVGMVLLVPLALPWLALRSRWYRLTALVCSLLALMLYTLLALAGGWVLWPSALIVLLSVFTPQPS